MEKIKVEVKPLADGTVPAEGELLELAVEAGWSEDPGTGKAILIPDERGAPGYEVLNPLPHAPPIGWEPTPPIEELIRQRVQTEMRKWEDEEVDDIVDAEDFDIPDELPALDTIYEFMGLEREAPAVKPPTAEERAAADVAYEELLEQHRRMRKGRAREEYERILKKAREDYGEPPDDPNMVRTSNPSE